jgi:hypothetical protein
LLIVSLYRTSSVNYIVEQVLIVSLYRTSSVNGLIISWKKC